MYRNITSRSRRRFLQGSVAGVVGIPFSRHLLADLIVGYAPAGSVLKGYLDLTNLSRSVIEGAVAFPDGMGIPRTLRVDGRPAGTFPLRLPPLASARLVLEADELSTGSLQIPAVADSDLLSLFTFVLSGPDMPAGGVSSSVQPGLLAKDWTLPVRGEPDRTSTGISVYAFESADVVITFVDASGVEGPSGEFHLDRNTQTQFFLQQLLPVGERYLGAARITAGGLVVAQSITQDLRNRSLSINHVVPEPVEQRELVFPHLALGAPWKQVRFLLHNRGEEGEEGEIVLHHPDGAIVRTYAVGRRGTLEVVVEATTASVRRYFATVRSKGGLTRLLGSAFCEQEISGYPGSFSTSAHSTGSNRNWVLSAVNEELDDLRGAIPYRTGLALLSPSTQDLNLLVHDDRGQITGQSTIRVDADRITAIFPGEGGVPAVPPGISTVRVEGAEPLYVSGLDVNFRTSAINNRPARGLSTPLAGAVGFHGFEYSGQDPIFDAAGIGAGEYYNPILAGFYPDPSICRVGEDYYLVNSTFAYFPGIPVSHSRDLVNWRQIGHVIHRPEQLRYDGIGVSGAIFAPAITHHEGLFWVVCTMVGGGGNFVVTASDPAGPWSDPVFLHFEGIDPSLYFDDDGRAWMVNNGAPIGAPLYDGHRAIWIQEFDPAGRRMIGPRKLIVNGGVDLSAKPIWIEGPHIYKRQGWYYLCCAEGGTGPGHSQVIFRSRRVDGPYMPWDRNPILTQRDLPPDVPGAVTSLGHADLEIGPDGLWWAVFLGVRPYQRDYSPMGRETFLLPVSWTEDGWPMMLPPGVRLPLTGPSPEGAQVLQPPDAPLNGSFTWRDSFDRDELSPVWIMLRQPKENWWSLDPASGMLELTPRPDSLAGTGNPSYLGRRVQHAVFSASTEVDVPLSLGVSAGLAAFQGERHHYFLAVRREGAFARVYLERIQGGELEEIAFARVPASGKIALGMDAVEAQVSFRYRADGGEWVPLVEGADAKILTTHVAGGFVGATVGMHARIDHFSNPVIWADVPDPAVVRVGRDYYMSSTTMHLSPGLPIMKSRDLVKWKLVGYAYDTLEDSDALALRNGRNAYGAGSWASSLRFHQGRFYVSTFSQTTGRTYVFSTDDIESGTWVKSSFSPVLHDNSLFFDDDGRVYMVYGAGDIRIIELNADAAAIKPGGLNQVIVPNASAVAGPKVGLPAEGSHLRKINGRYYLLTITWPPGDMRTALIHRADRITGPYEGRVALRDQGVAQGGLIDTPEDDWFAFLFQDHGAVGRVPYLVPVAWQDGWPVLGRDGKVPVTLDLPAGRDQVAGVVTSDEFDREPGEAPLPLAWQWNHNPDSGYWSVDARPGWLRLTNGRLVKDLTEAPNMLTQRTFGPVCSAVTAVDVTGMKDGDTAGLTAFQKRYGFVGVVVEGTERFVVVVSAESESPVETGRVPLDRGVVRLRVDCDFRNRTDRAYFYYSVDGMEWVRIGRPLRMTYTLPHFMGYRFGLFNLARKVPGGVADFDYYRLGDRIPEES